VANDAYHESQAPSAAPSSVKSALELALMNTSARRNLPFTSLASAVEPPAMPTN
jgi:hypothetical protein